MRSAGDSGAIETLLRFVQGDIRRYVRRTRRNTSDAEEAAQETLMLSTAR
jgi:DNA-directed RNA polymerase specialized sigma24 family protein